MRRLSPQWNYAPKDGRMKSCKDNRGGQTFCDDPNCGDRDPLGFHWSAGHPQSREMKNWHAENDPATKGDIRRLMEAIEKLSR
jgi:hypothetical protein